MQTLGEHTSSSSHTVTMTSEKDEEAGKREDMEDMKDTVASMTMLQQTWTRPRSFRQFWKGEWMEEQRVPIWHDELRQTRRIVAREWGKTSMDDFSSSTLHLLILNSPHTVHRHPRHSVHLLGRLSPRRAKPRLAGRLGRRL